MTKQERRSIRREYINYCLHSGEQSQEAIKADVRSMEFNAFGYELNVYGNVYEATLRRRGIIGYWNY